MLTKPKSWSQVQNKKISVCNIKYPCGVCTFGVGATSILCTSCNLWVHSKCSGKTDDLTDSRNFACHKCFSEIISAAIAPVKEVSIRNDKFHVGPTFKYLGDTISHVVAFLVQSLHVLFHSRKHSKNC